MSGDQYNKTPKVLKVQEHFNINDIEKFQSSTKKKVDNFLESKTLRKLISFFFMISKKHSLSLFLSSQ